MPWVVDDKRKFIATEKVDGTSTTFSMRNIRASLQERSNMIFMFVQEM